MDTMTMYMTWSCIDHEHEHEHEYEHDHDHDHDHDHEGHIELKPLIFKLRPVL
jgi:ABC-type Zn2+ transport system substrate-binding protein/surface adhesin